jgi:ABC-type multidrug transport system fused ATPase/permease subunit
MISLLVLFDQYIVKRRKEAGQTYRFCGRINANNSTVYALLPKVYDNEGKIYYVTAE